MQQGSGLVLECARVAAAHGAKQALFVMLQSMLGFRVHPESLGAKADITLAVIFFIFRYVNSSLFFHNF